jgi:hypothetical protein
LKVGAPVTVPVVPTGMTASVDELVDGPLLSRRFAVVRTAVPGANPPCTTVGVRVAVGVRVGVLVGVALATGVLV